MNGANPKAFTIPGVAALGFRVYPAATSGNVAIIDDLKIYDELPAAPAFTITPAVNDDDMGSAELTGAATITATPNDGYRVISGNGGYTVSSGSATVTNNGDNTFSVIPTSNCTITINFEAIPTRTITLGSHEGGSVIIQNAGTVIPSGSSVREGETLTIIAAAGEGKRFTNWTVSGATPASTTDATTTFIVGENNVTIAATFEDATTYPIHWSVNGIVIRTDNVVEDEAISFTAPASGVPTGFVFKGWTADVIDGVVSTYSSSNYVTAATATVEKTYYAVMAVEVPGDIDVLDRALTGITDGSSSYDTWFGKTATSNAVYAGKSAGGNNSIQIRSKNSDSGVITTASGGTAKKVTIGWQSDTQAGRKLNVYGKNSAYSAASDLFGDNKGTLLGSVVKGTSTELVISGDYAFIGFCADDGAMYLSTITIEWGTYTNFCTSLTPIPINTSDIDEEGNLKKDVTISSGAYYVKDKITIKSGLKLIVNESGSLGNSDASKLVVEDGGQLICNNSVAATVKKGIDSWNNGARSVSGWNFIASPIAANVDPTTVTNLINETPENYDLYRLNMGTEYPGKEWENYKNAVHTDFELVNGMGYLYANADGVDLAFSGDIQPSNTTVTKSGLYEGYNLVGNPFTCNAYLNRSYYTLNSDGSAVEVNVPKTASIAPCTGVIIESSSVTFSKNSLAVESSNNGNIQIALAQNVVTRDESTAKTLDKAIVSFNEDDQLGKFYFGSQDANLYIPMDNEEYAIVSSSAQGEMPVNFKAHRDGQYTITVNPQEVEMGYLHLIDNIAGKDIDLLATPSYTFNAKADDYESRFRLVFSANMVNADLDNDFAFFSNGQLVIANEGESILQVIDVNGRIVITESVSGTCSKAINVKAGVYVLRLIQGTDVKTQKIIVK